MNIGTQIEVFNGERVARAKSWAALSNEDLKRHATVAAHARDADELWGLSEAYLTLRGNAGARVSRHTIRNYARGVRDLVEAWEGENLLRPSRDAGNVYLRDLEAQGRTPGTVRVKLAAARLLYKALRWSGATEAVPFDNAKPGRETTAPEDKRKPYSHDAVEALLSKAAPVDKVMVLLGAHSGLRASEMMALRWNDIDLQEQTLLVREGKGGKQRTVELGPTILEALEHLRGMSDGEKVLPFGTTNRARQRMRRLCERSSVKYLGVHALRHYSGTRLAKERELRDVARHLGHASIQTTSIYAKWNREALRSSVGMW